MWSLPIKLLFGRSRALPIKRRQIKQLVKEGRLEFTSGSWVMTDEATPHLYSMLDQMTEGDFYYVNSSIPLPSTSIGH